MLRNKDTGGTLRTISELSHKDNGGVVRVLQKLSVKVGGTLKLVYSSLTAAASTPISGSVSNPFPSNVTTSSTTATPTGGVGPFTYSWRLTDALGGGGWAIDTPAAATTTLTCSHLAPGEDASAEIECVVTDSVGSTATTNRVIASALNNG